MHPKGEGECKSTIVLPALCQAWVDGLQISELGAFSTSKAKTVPSGRRVHPSSALKSLFPELPSNVHVNVAGSSAATCMSSLRPTTNRPSGKTTEGESPM